MSFVTDPTAQETDILRLVRFPYRGSPPQTIIDLHDGDNYALVASTFKVTAPERRQQFSESGRRYGGARLAQETHGNGQISAEWYIRGDTADETVTLAEALLQTVEEINERTKLYVAWQPAEAAHAVYYEIRGIANWEPQYRWIEFKQTQTLHLALGLQVAPLAEGLPLYIMDRFTAITEKNDYTSCTDTTSDDADWTISAGSIKQTGNYGFDVDLYHTGRGYDYGDQEATLKVTLGGALPAGPSSRAGVILKGQENGDRLKVVWRDSSGAQTIDLIAHVAGVDSSPLGTISVTAPRVVGDVFYIRGWIERDRVYIAYWAGTAPESAPTHATAHNLNTTNAAIFGYQKYGKAGISFRSQDAGTIGDDFVVRPFAYNGAATSPATPNPETLYLDGQIYGTAKAKADIDVVISNNAGDYLAPFALFAWAPEPITFANMIWNGDFELDTAGWTIAAPLGSNPLHSAGTSITRVTTEYFAGSASAQIVLPATIGAGAHFKVFRKVHHGRKYYLRFRARVTSGTASLSVGVGTDTTAFAGSGTVTATTAWQEFTAEWVPTSAAAAAAGGVHVYIKNEAAAAETIQIDAVSLSTLNSTNASLGQSEGRGGYPPFGVLKAMARSSLSGFTTPAENATYVTGTALTTTSALEFYLDPLLLPADDFTDGELQVEVWAKISVLTNPATATVMSMPGRSGFGATRYTSEFGNAGKTLRVLGSAATDWQTVRLGTITFEALAADSMRSRLRVEFTPTKGTQYPTTLNVMDLYLTPIKRRALTPTGKVLDASYPKFLPNVSGQKRILSNLSGQQTSTPSAGFYTDSGLGGEPIELDPTSGTRLFMKLADQVPDDPTSVTAETGPVAAKVYVDVVPRWFLARS